MGKVSAFDQNGVVLGYGGAAATNAALWGVYIREVSGSYYFAMSARKTNGGAYSTIRGNTVLTSGTWYYVTYSTNGSTWKIRVNGATAETLTNVLGTNTGDWIGDVAPTTPDKSDIGAVYAGGAYSNVNFWHGTLDEVRLSNVERSNDWVSTEYNSQSSPSTFYSVSSATSLAVPSQVSWLVTDQLGTPRMIIDQSGSLANVKRHDYLPFGEELFAPTGGRSATLGYTAGDGVRQQFTLKERDNETGLDYFEARYYSSSQGRFTSPDEPLVGQDASDPQTWNLYSYTSSSPLNRVDEDGRRWFYKCGDGGCDVQWVNANKDGTYTSPGEGYKEFIPTKEQPNLIIYSSDGYQVYRFGENADGSPRAKWLWTGKVEDRPDHMIAAVDLGRNILSLLRGAVSSFVAWRAAKAEEAAVEALLKNYHPNNELGKLAKEVVDKGGRERMTAIEREAAARFYEKAAARVGGKYSAAARRLNLARAKYLREGGVPPGKIHGFK